MRGASLAARSLRHNRYRSPSFLNALSLPRREESEQEARLGIGRGLCGRSWSRQPVLMGPSMAAWPQLDGRQARTMVTWLPEAMQSFSIWGGSGYMLKTLHVNGSVPYWACFAGMSVIVRTCLFPLVLYGSHTSSRFAKVVPEVQFILTLFQNDMKKMREKKASLAERVMLMRTNLGTLGGVYKLHKINPFSVFLSPLLQLPIFMYISIDLRKIVNGLDPILAQQLVESSVAWVPDLTEADPWYGLPILAGLCMYWNVEVAIGRRSLSGPAAAKMDTSNLLKDVFQSLAVFMPCFTSQLPAGVQIYVVTSFLYTLGQSAALRSEPFRKIVGLPSMLAPPPEAKYAKEFVALKELEQKARELRGDGPLLGKGVLAQDLEVSFPGRYRKSTIQGSGLGASSPEVVDELPAVKVDSRTFLTGPFINGVSAPPWQLAEQQRQIEQEEALAKARAAASVDEREYMPEISAEVMEKANRGELPIATKVIKKELPKAPKLSLKRLKKTKGAIGSKRKPKR